MRNGSRNLGLFSAGLLVIILSTVVSCAPQARPPVAPAEAEEQEAQPTVLARRVPVPAGSPAETAVSLQPGLPRHYQHVRLAALAYHGNPFGASEQELLRNSVDLVVVHPSYLQKFQAVAPKTPLLLYSNISNLYQDLLTGWLEFADAQGLSREAAFYHAAQPKSYKGNSASSQPVTWFWRVWRGKGGLANLTAAARGQAQPFTLGLLGEAVYVGHLERYREINLTLGAGADPGWQCQFEYCSRLNPNGSPAEWTALKVLGDSTQGATRSGQITFDPPRDWKPATINATARLYYIRLRTTTIGSPSLVTTILGRDYVQAAGKQEGIVPAFDRAADADGDGYLNDQEYLRRATGKEARFLYESRLPTQYFGQMRFLTYPGAQAFRTWAVAQQRQLLEKNPQASGIFMDNSDGVIYLKPGETLEPVERFAVEQGQLLAAVRQAIAPRWVLGNSCGGDTATAPIIRQNPAYFEEFALKPLAQHYQQFENLRELLTQRARLTTPPPLAVLDSHPQNGSPDDPRTQLATLAEYYLLASQHTFLTFFGGFEPATTWERHWVPAVARDIGQPFEECSEKMRGIDPANPQMQCRVYQRRYQNALVLYRPLSYAPGKYLKAALGDDSAVRINLSELYRPLRADNSLGEPTAAVSLRNGEGAILLRLK